ncbi:MAG: hypothetical protein J6Y35_02090, partial [Bacteroidales bacterium]|nr:hypothetical protein [Bacteroidales bacterium]
PPLLFLFSPVSTTHHSADRQGRGISCYSAIGSSSSNSRHLRNSRLSLFRSITLPFFPYLPPVPRAGAREYSPSFLRRGARSAG